VDMKLELVFIPVTDIERAKKFYTEKLDFNADHDTSVGDDVRIIQLTPPGSACSIFIAKGLPGIDQVQPGSVKAMHLVVGNIEKAREEHLKRGLEVAEITDHGRGVKSAGFSDPDGNSWLFQEMSWRATEFEE
jgi:catechol 2,3-dioxygenase-like lactoylglutathione lyase family enzyme